MHNHLSTICLREHSAILFIQRVTALHSPNEAFFTAFFACGPQVGANKGGFADPELTSLPYHKIRRKIPRV